jgi:EmrB/QacA subfamily drug resistance transporter
VPRNILVPLIVACALFMQNTDSTVISTALPVIAKSIGEDPIALKLALTSYLVSLAVFIPISGWMADKLGARTVFRASIVVFLIGSVLCALSTSLAAFVGARFFQGIGAAMMVPVGRLVLLRTVPKSELVRAFALLTMPATVGPVFGPMLGGFIATYFDWRWIFFINIPFGILGIILATLFIENVREDNVAPLDFTGFVLVGSGLAILMLGLATGGRYLVPIEGSVACVVAGVALIALYLRHARRVAAPVLKLPLLKIPTMETGVIAGSLFRIAVGATPFLLPLMFQVGFGLSAWESGLLTFATAAGALFIRSLSARILRKYGFRTVLAVNGTVALFFIVAMGFFTPTTPHAVILLVLFIGGGFRALELTSLNTLSFADVDSKDMSYATSLTSVAQQLSLSLGVAVGAFALQAGMAVNGHADPKVGDFAPAFVITGLIAATSLYFILKLPPDAGAEVSGHNFSARKATAEAERDGTA